VRVLRPGGRFIFDTINRTWLSKLVMIWAAQDILRFAPAHTHDFQAFIQPGELRAALETRGMQWRDLRGLSFARHPLVAGALYLRRRRLGGFRLSDDTRISYLGFAEKPV
jgi:2-polyprenyl-6-hydroxyphenyl methylase/3-demethylubiquinone-9 3-methyltransferase